MLMVSEIYVITKINAVIREMIPQFKESYTNYTLISCKKYINFPLTH